MYVGLCVRAHEDSLTLSSDSFGEKDAYKMKVVYVNTLDIFYTPPTIRMLLHAKVMMTQGFDVSTISFKEPRRVRDKPIRGLEEIPCPFHELEPFSFWTNVAEMFRLLKGADLIVLEKVFPYATLPLLFANAIRGIPMHLDLSDDDAAHAKIIYRYPLWSWIVQLYQSVVIKVCHSVSVASGALREQCLKKNISVEHLTFVPACVNTKIFKRDETLRKRMRERLGIQGRPSFLYLGGMELGTDTDLILEAFASLTRGFAGESRPFLMMVGSGTMLEALRKKTVDLGITQDVFFSGPILNHELTDYLSAADVGLAPMPRNNYTVSKSPIKIVEYLSYGLPVITSDVGDNRHMVGEAGWVIENFKPAVLAQKMVDVVRGKADITEKSVVARKRAEDVFDVNIVGGHLVDFLKKTYSNRSI